VEAGLAGSRPFDDLLRGAHARLAGRRDDGFELLACEVDLGGGCSSSTLVGNAKKEQGIRSLIFPGHQRQLELPQRIKLCQNEASVEDQVRLRPRVPWEQVVGYWGLGSGLR
jgi:hypothetical protein